MPDQMLTQDWIDQRVYDLYDEYCHGRLDRRSFLQKPQSSPAVSPWHRR